MNFLQNFFHFVIWFIALKSMLIGSDFDFYLWFKHGKKYTAWYNNRPSFKDVSQ